MANGTRRAHTRNGRPVRSAAIRRPKPQTRRTQMARKARRRSTPMLYAAGVMAGLGALEAILLGRWGTAFVLFFSAGCFLVSHVAWQAHKRHQAAKAPTRQPAAPRKTAAQPAGADPEPAGNRAEPTAPKGLRRASAAQRREALEKARAAHQPESKTPPVPEDGGEQYANSSRANGTAPSGPPAGRVRQQRSESNRTNGHTSEPPGPHGRNGHRCDCTKCRAARRAAEKEAEVLR